MRRSRKFEITVIRILTSILSVLIIFAAGCSDTAKITIQDSNTPKINTCAGMIEYLRKQNLPTLKSVEVWQNQYGDGLVITTEHYEVYTTLLEPLMLSQVPGFLESAYNGYQDQLPESIETTTKFTVYVFADRQQWDDFTKGFVGLQAPLYLKIKVGAYYLNGACVAYNIGRERTFSVLGHEGWHQFNSRHFRFRLPSWLDEGVAMLFEASRYERGLFYFEPDKNMSRLGSLRKTLLNNRMIPVKELISINPGEAIMASDDTVTAFYGQSYAMVRFLREEDYGKRLSNYHRLLLGGLEGNWPISETNKRIAMNRNIPLTIGWNRTVGTELFKLYVSDNFDQIEQEYTAFCRKIVYHVRLKDSG